MDPSIPRRLALAVCAHDRQAAVAPQQHLKVNAIRLMLRNEDIKNVLKKYKLH